MSELMKIMGLIVLLIVSFVVFSGWYFLSNYCLTAVEHLSKHPKFNFVIHMFTGLGSGLLIGLWMPTIVALVLGPILLIIAVVTRYVIPTEKLPEHLKSSGMGRGLPTGLGIAWLVCPWMLDTTTLILGAVSIVGAETIHYIYPNLVVKAEKF